MAGQPVSGTVLNTVGVRCCVDGVSAYLGSACLVELFLPPRLRVLDENPREARGFTTGLSAASELTATSRPELLPVSRVGSLSSQGCVVK